MSGTTAKHIARMSSSGNPMAPESWRRPSEHFRVAVESPWYRLLFKMMGELVYTTNDFFRRENCEPALMPITCGSVSSPMGLGSDSLPVKVDLFGESTYLADSMQFQLEYMLRHDTDGVFYIMPTFRGEDPDARHLNQFFHAEAEIRGDLNDVMALVGRYVHALTYAVKRAHGSALDAHGIGTDHLDQMLRLRGHIPEISYRDALKLLAGRDEHFECLPGGIITISRAGERRVMNELGGIVWLTHFPHATVPFYQAYDEDGEHARCADLLFGIGEVVGCGERHITATQTRDALAKHVVEESEYAWYLQMKELYPMQTAGFGLGIERFLLWILRHDDIRDVTIMNRLKGMVSVP